MHAFSSGSREEYNMGGDRSHSKSQSEDWSPFWSEIEIGASAGCFAFLIFRVNPNICLWVFIICTHNRHWPVITPVGLICYLTSKPTGHLGSSGFRAMGKILNIILLGSKISLKHKDLLYQRLVFAIKFKNEGAGLLEEWKPQCVFLAPKYYRYLCLK